MPKLFPLFLVLTFCMATNAFAEDSCTFNPKAAPQDSENWQLKRGLNLSWWWHSPRKNEFSVEEFRHLRSMGFTFIRLPVSQDFLEIEDAKAQAARMKELRCDMASVLNSGLGVVLDFHPTRDFNPIATSAKSNELLSHLVNYWKVLGASVLGLPEDRIYLELWNEPYKELESSWWETQGRLVQALRPLFPNHTFIATQTESSYWKITSETPYDDKNIIYDFHFYRPVFFTHHNVKWSGLPKDPRQKTDRVRYPASEEMNNDPSYDLMQKYKAEGWDKEELAKLIVNRPVTWSQKTGARVVCLEFGVYRYFVDDMSRARWIKDVREILEENGIPWAMWDYKGAFGLYNLGGNFDPNVNAALGLK